MKQLLRLSLILCVYISSYAQNQIGSDIDGEAAGDGSGVSVSLSSDGTVVAIGAVSNAANGLNSGHVRVYQNVLGVWTQIGSDIDGEAANDQSSRSVSLSSDGSVVAIGAFFNDGNGLNSGHVRVYQNVLGVWTQIGSDIDGDAVGDFFGYSVSLSSDGSIVAIGARFNDANASGFGYVRLYQNISGAWTQIGPDIDGESTGNESGYSVSLSSDGNVIAIGAIGNNANGSDSGHVRVYQNVSGIWTQIGSDIDGEASDDELGFSVSLSSDGTVVAIGAPFNDGNGSNSGHVRVYQNVSGVWNQIGSDIDGEAASDVSGIYLSLSSDGSVVAIGATGNDGNGSNSGHVRVYQNISGTWTQIGSDFDGELASDRSGAVSLSSDGAVLAIGATGNDGNGSFSGHVRVYDLSAILSITDFNSSTFNVIANNIEDTVTISLSNAQQLVQANLYNISGQYLFSSKQTVMSTKGLATGVYIIEVETTNGRSAKKVVLN